ARVIRVASRSRSRFFCSSVRLGDASRSNRRVTRVSSLFTFCPPGPPLREVTKETSSSGIARLSPISIIAQNRSTAVQLTCMSVRPLALLLPLLALLAAAPGGAVLFDTDPPQPPIAVTLRHVLGGLDRPTSIAHAGDVYGGDDRLFLTLQGGLVVIVEGGALRPEPFLDIRSLMTESHPGPHSGEQGLLGLAFHPRYAQNGFFFVDYTDRLGAVVIARYQVSSDPQRADPASGRILLTIPKPYVNHNGGQLQFGPDGHLYVSVGDGGGAGGPSCFSQKTDTLLGKLLRLDVDANAGTPPYHGIPADNPFPGSP